MTAVAESEVFTPDRNHKQPTAIEAIARADIDIQITTARRYPRDTQRALNRARELATINEHTAEGCFYSIPRGGKNIEGPSVRLAEILASGWGNLRVAARVIAGDATTITAQAVCHDLETNVAISREVKRKITDKHGKRYTDDMIIVTENAACSIALRNAVFAVVPKALWLPIYEATKATAGGTEATLTQRRADLVVWFSKRGIGEADLLKLAGRTAVIDIGLEDLAKLKGVATAIVDGETTVDAILAELNPKPAAGLADRAKEASERAKAARDATEGTDTQSTPANAVAQAETVSIGNKAASRIVGMILELSAPQQATLAQTWGVLTKDGIASMTFEQANDLKIAIEQLKA